MKFVTAPHYTQVLRLITRKTGRVEICLTIGKKEREDCGCYDLLSD